MSSATTTTTAAAARSAISIRLASRPIEGCVLRAAGVVRSKEFSRDEVELRWRWRRGERVVPNCAYEGCEAAYDYDPVSASRRGAGLLCAACLKQGVPRRESLTFCSRRCFVRAWPTHKARHVARRRARTDSDLAASDDAAPRPEDDEWELVAEGAAFEPSAAEVGRRLQVECVGVVGERARARGSTVTEVVLAAPGPPPERHWFGEPSEGEERIRLASYNVLAEIYATSNVYPYCPRWALDWSYRSRRLVDEILEADPDVVCLQEAQRDHYERDLEPALEARGYEGAFAQKSREAMGAAGKVDGCAMFWKRHKFRLAEQRTVSFNDIARAEAAALSLADRDEHAYLLRLVKDNVAQFAVLEAYASRRRLCVANTHLYSNKDFADTKLWQALHLLRQLEAFVSRPRADRLPILLAGDFNSQPHSAVYDLLVSGRVDPHHPDLQHYLALPDAKTKLSVLPDHRDVAHALNLASAYHSLLAAEPPYTNFTRNFAGTLDYLIFDPTALRCLAVANIPDADLLTTSAPWLPNALFPSDHLMLIADFKFLL